MKEGFGEDTTIIQWKFQLDPFMDSLFFSDEFGGKKEEIWIQPKANNRLARSFVKVWSFKKLEYSAF